MHAIVDLLVLAFRIQHLNSLNVSLQIIHARFYVIRTYLKLTIILMWMCSRAQSFALCKKENNLLGINKGIWTNSSN